MTGQGSNAERTATAERAFRARVAELGGTVLEPVWLGTKKPHRARCAAGHECAPRPDVLSRGDGMCRACVRLDTATAERAFRTRVAELGGTVLEPVWLGNGRPHRLRCAAGHDCAPRPGSIQQRQGLCLVCAGQHPAAAERAFRARVAELGATVLEPVWLGSGRPHRLRCAAGHECAPTPGHVQQGTGICRLCAGHVWDVFYVVTSLDRLKFGITSGNPAPRLRTHRAAGYRTALRLLTDLPGLVAPELERAVRAALVDAGERPVNGREYYDVSVTALVLDIVDNDPSIRLTTVPAT